MRREHSWVIELPIVSEHYLAEDTSHLPPTAWDGLDSYLCDGGPLLALVEEVRRLREVALRGVPSEEAGARNETHSSD